MTTKEHNGGAKLEPRVASLEIEVRQVVKLVGDLSSSFDRVESQIQQLALLIERVSAPKQANWFAIVGTGVSVVLLFLTVGGLVLLPMTKELSRWEHWQEEHIKLDLHPKGQVRLDALEKVVTERAAVNAAGIKDLDIKLQKEYQLMDASVRERVGAVERELRERWIFDADGIEKISDKQEKVLNRLAILETQMAPLTGSKHKEN